ncbi:MAG: CDP-diacylglycerol--glycerol-3-phosphate 3-phosphatidyltransferase [Candidatus Neomarinimicrobiota bacterium]
MKLIARILKGSSLHSMMPNILTVGRILLTPIFIICLFYDAPWARPAALLVFIVASVTDAWDGYIARKRNLVTKAGAFLDPLADKILVSSAFISFAIMGKVPYWMAALIIFRDMFVTGLRMLFLSRGISLVTSKIAKFKTVTQVAGVLLVLSYLAMKKLSLLATDTITSAVDSLHLIYYALLAVTLFTAYTGLSYLFINRQTIWEFISTPHQTP